MLFFTPGKTLSQTTFGSTLLNFSTENKISAFADDKFMVAHVGQVIFKKLENFVEKEDNSGYQNNTTFPRMVSEVVFFFRRVKRCYC